jgi:hypothetical protein
VQLDLQEQLVFKVQQDQKERLEFKELLVQLDLELLVFKELLDHKEILEWELLEK